MKFGTRGLGCLSTFYRVIVLECEDLNFHGSTDMANNGFLRALSFQIAMRSGYCCSKCKYETASQ